MRGPVAAAFAVLAAALVAAWLGSPPLERAIRDRIRREAARQGLVSEIEAVHVGLWPPLALKGLHLDKPGSWSLAVDTVEVTLRPGGQGLLGRTRLVMGHLRLIAPGGLALEAMPTRWDVKAASPGGYRAELREPVPGLSVTWLPAAGAGSRAEVQATDLPASRLLTFEHARVPCLDAGTLDGTLALGLAPGSSTFEMDVRGRGVRVATLANGDTGGASEAPAFGLPTDVTLRLGGRWRRVEGVLELPHWRVTAAGAVLSGSLSLADVPRDPRVELALEVERVNLARLLGSAGVDQPGALTVPLGSDGHPADLGSASLSARMSGRLQDPTSFVVSQRLDFTPPARPLPALERLRGDFVHEVEGPDGLRRAIAVSPASPDFLALRDVPPLFVKTLLLGEDATFFDHRGIDLSELPSAVIANWTRGEPARGASTITQQLAKNLFLSRERRLGRKLQELSLALLLEATLGKERILEIYLNIIEWGPDLYGLRPASRRYFSKDPRDLTPKQMALLVALVPGPVKYQRSLAGGTPSPGFLPMVDNLLAKLRAVDALSEQQYEAALAEQLFVNVGGAEGPEASGSPASLAGPPRAE
jgi:hypothetical protein